MRILVVADDVGIADGLQANLQQRGYAVDRCSTLAHAWAALQAESFDAVLTTWCSRLVWTSWRPACVRCCGPLSPDERSRADLHEAAVTGLAALPMQGPKWPQIVR